MSAFTHEKLRKNRKKRKSWKISFSRVSGCHNEDTKVDFSFDVDNWVQVKELLNENKIANEIFYVYV